MKKEKSCGCIIVEDGKVLLIKQTMGHWGFPKGHVEKNETEEQTALRETKEETNLDVYIDKNKRYTMEYETDKGILKEVVLFIAKKQKGIIKLQEKEVTNVKWCGAEEALKTISYDSSKNLLKKVIEDNRELFSD